MRAVALQVRIVTQAEILPGEILRVRIQKELKNHNSGFGGGNRHGHWSGRHREREAWRAAIMDALIDNLGAPLALRFIGFPTNVQSRVGWSGGLQCKCLPKPWQKTKRCMCPESYRRRLTITRWVPSMRNFIRDVDNCYAVTKSIRDSIKGLGLIRDDSDRWLDMPKPIQAVSVDGLYWTEFTIAPMELPQ